MRTILPVLLATLLAAACGSSGGGADAPDATVPATDVAADAPLDLPADTPAADLPADLPPADLPADPGPSDPAPVDLGPADPGTDPGPATLGAVPVQQLHEELAAKDFLLINVHVPHEGEIPGTDTHIAFDQVDALAAYIGADLDREATLYCLTNGMSTLAGNALVDRGYRAIRYLDGGMMAWKAAGYALDPYP